MKENKRLLPLSEIIKTPRTKLVPLTRKQYLARKERDRVRRLEADEAKLRQAREMGAGGSQ